MDEFVRDLVQEYNLPERSRFYLGSIAFQENEHNINPDKIKSCLRNICDIVRRYQNPVDALKIIDKIFDEYLLKLSKIPEKEREGRFTGDISTLSECERSVSESAGSLILYGLESRVEEILLSKPQINTSVLYSSGKSLLKGQKDPFDPREPDPAQENALRILEDLE